MAEVLRYESSLADIRDSQRPIIFLAGPTVRGNQPHLTSWRFEAIEEFERQGFGGILVVPEFSSKTESDKGKVWIPAWEFAGLCISDVNLFWIPRTKELIGLTTNHEHGYWLAKKREKVVYGRPDDAYRNTYLDLMWVFDPEQSDRPPDKIYGSLSETIKASISRAKHNLYRFRTYSKVAVDSPYGEFDMTESIS